MDHRKLKDASPWHPMQEPVDLKHLGKLLEELGECTAAVSRCLIQGIAESEPVTGKLNRDWLQDEVADVRAGLELVTRHFGLDRSHIADRTARKIVHLSQWHKLA